MGPALAAAIGGEPLGVAHQERGAARGQEILHRRDLGGKLQAFRGSVGSGAPGLARAGSGQGQPLDGVGRPVADQGRFRAIGQHHPRKGAPMGPAHVPMGHVHGDDHRRLRAGRIRRRIQKRGLPPGQFRDFLEDREPPEPFTDAERLEHHHLAHGLPIPEEHDLLPIALRQHLGGQQAIPVRPKPAQRPQGNLGILQLQEPSGARRFHPKRARRVREHGARGLPAHGQPQSTADQGEPDGRSKEELVHGRASARKPARAARARSRTTAPLAALRPRWPPARFKARWSRSPSGMAGTRPIIALVGQKSLGEA